MDKIEELLTRGVDQLIPSKEELEKVLRSGKKLRVYQGFDPSSPVLHIGHMIGLRKLRQWQELGHEVIFLIGDFTGMIGDPSGREETRPVLSRKTVDENAKTYKEQAGKILDFDGKNPIQIKFNSQWLDKLKTPEIINLFSKVTYQQIIKRGMFKKRLENDGDISFGEVTYPIMQGYDSVAMDIDVEVGGRDQLFNMLVGRDLMHKIKGKNKFVMTTQLLEDSQGNKIGKTEGNAIALTDEPNKMFGAIMTFPDDAIIKGLEYLTNVSVEEIESAKKSIEKGENPIKYKKLLAFEITKQLHGQKAADEASERFESTFQKGTGFTSQVKFTSGKTIADIALACNLVESKSELKRLAAEGAIDLDNKTISDINAEPKDGQILKLGKKRVIKLEEEK